MQVDPFHIEADTINYHEAIQQRRVERALKLIDPGDVLAISDARVAAEPDPQAHPLNRVTISFPLVASCWAFARRLRSACVGGRLAGPMGSVSRPCLPSSGGSRSRRVCMSNRKCPYGLTWP